MTGLFGALFNTFGNIGAITTPIVIGYIVAVTGSFSWALVYVSINALMAVIAYTLISGRFERIQLRKSDEDPRSQPHLETCP
jgi:ACS family glucarate transporter-like MFS transporter